MCRSVRRLNEHDQSSESGDGQSLVLGILGALLLASLTLGPLLNGIGVFGWQVLGWLSSGVWTPVTFLDFMHWAGVRREWVDNPTSWIGLWSLLNSIPLSVLLIVLGVMMSVGLLTARPNRQDPLDEFWKQMRGGRPTEGQQDAD